MKRHNIMLEARTLTAIDSLAAEVRRKGGTKLTRSAILRACTGAVEGALRRCDVGLPEIDSGEELEACLRDWMIENELESRKLHTYTPEVVQP